MASQIKTQKIVPDSSTQTETVPIIVQPSWNPVHPITNQLSVEPTTPNFFKKEKKSLKISSADDPLPSPPSTSTYPDPRASLKVEMPALSSVYVADQEETEDGINEIPTSVINALFKEHNFDEDLKMHIWDFAGQDLYYTTHQVFLSRKAVYVVVFDLTKDLLEPAGKVSVDGAIVESTLGRQYSHCGHHHELTCLDFLDFWMRSIYTFTLPNEGKEDELDQLSPPIFIVGTHKNSLHEDPKIRNEMVKEKFTQIANFVAEQCYRKHVVYKYYAVENSLRPFENTEVTALKNHIGKVARKEPYIGERIPLMWLLFQKEVQDLASKGTPHITLKEAETLYQQLPGNQPQQASSSEKELLTMLEFYHDLGQLVYIKDGGEDLRNLVILDPNWLIKLFKEVISVVDMEEKRGKDIDSWKRLTERGILDDQLVTHLWRDILKCKESNTIDESRKNALLQLMKIFDLLCDKDTNGMHEKCYFVPSRLQRESNPFPYVDVESNQSSCHPARVFYIDFDGFLPDGFFHRVMVRAAKWSQQQGGNEPTLSYRMITLYADDYHKCVLEMAPAKDARVKVLVTPVDIIDMPDTSCAENDRSLTKACCKVKAFLEETLSDLKEVWAKRIEYTFCIACPCAVQTFHLLPLGDCMGSRDAIECAYKNRTHTGRVKLEYCLEGGDEKDHRLGESVLHLEDLLTETFFFELAEKLGEEWKRLASNLDFTHANIVHLVSNAGDNMDNQIHNMLLSWRRKQPPADPGSAVKRLRDALKVCGREDLAHFVEEYVQGKL